MKTINYGIDLGTSNSCIAYANEGKAEIFKSDEGTDFIPSAVMFRDGAFLVGEKVYRQYTRKPERIAIRFKRAMGTNQTISLEGLKPQRPEDLAAQVLIELRRMASLRGHEVEHAVICTPAKFDSAQVDATNEAARLAGIHDPVLISEPMAASYGYGVTSEKQGSWLVYDLGAGTFDAVVVQVREGKMTILDIEGANRLGGSDMDRIIWEELVRPELARQAGIPVEHPTLRAVNQGGPFDVESSKILLSSTEQTSLDSSEIVWGKNRLTIAGEELDKVVKLSRSAAEAKVEPLVEKTLTICRSLLARHKQVSEILLIGGPTKMPIVRRKLTELGLPLNCSVDPMTAVATGAALYASTQPVPQGKAVNVPFATPTAASGHVALQLDYEPTCEDTEAPLFVRCSDTRAGFAEVTSASRNWTSGRIPLNAGGHTLFVPIQPRKTNTFVVRAFTATGSALNCEPAEFFIQHSVLVTEAPPLPESLWVEVEGETEGKGRGVPIFEKGHPLPAKTSKRLKTTKELVRGSANEVYIKLFEGNSTVLHANNLVRLLPIKGDQVARKLPVGTEIEIVVKVDTSRRIEAEAYIPLTDESFDIPKANDRFDVSNPNQLEFRRLALARQVEAIEAENTNPDVKVKLELCRRLLWNDETMKAVRLAKEQGRETGDAHQRVDESLREAHEKLVLLQEKEEEHILPNEWRKACRHAGQVLATEWATPQDRERFDGIQQQGETALQRKRWLALRDATREMGRLAFNIEARDPEFWRSIADDLPSEPDCYTNPEEARLALARLGRPRSLDDLKADVVRLVKLLPSRGGDDTSGRAWVDLIA